MISSPTKVLAILSTTGYYGKERANLKVYHLIKEKGFDLRVVLNKQATRHLRENFSNINTISINFPTLVQRRYDRQISRILLNFDILRILNNYKPDILYLSDENVAFTIAPVLNRFKGKIIYRVGDELNLNRYGKRKFIYAFVWKNIVFKRINTFVSNSKFVKGSLEKEGRHNNHDRIIYNYPPFRNSSITLQLKERRKENAVLTFGYIGRFDKEKGCDHFINAANQILTNNKDVFFYLAGKRKEDDYTHVLVKLAKAFPNNIIFLDEIEDIKGFYNLVDVVCIPSVYQEPLSNNIIEAKQNFTPCIIYPSGGMPEIVRHQVDGFICEKSDYKCLQSGMEYYLEHSSEILTQGKNAFESINIFKMGFDDFQNNWLEVFND